MIISELEQLEILSQNESIGGGAGLRLRIDDGSAEDDSTITLGLDDRIIFSETLSNKEPLTYKFAGSASGLLTARRQRKGKQTVQTVSLTGTTKNGISFSFLTTSSQEIG